MSEVRAMAARDKLLGPPPDTLRILLNDPAEHDFPAAERIVSGLTPAHAVEVPNGVPYSIAQHDAYHLGQIVVLRRLIGAWKYP